MTRYRHHTGRNDRGFVTLMVLGLAMSITLALGAALRANYALANLNQRTQEALQDRAEAIRVMP